MSDDGSKKTLGIVLAIVLGGGILFLSECGGSDDSFDSGATTFSGSSLGTDPPVLNFPEEDQLVKRLKAAHDVQGVCYGWQINDTETGSHLGAPSKVSDDPSCEKSVEFVADYSYNSTDEEFTSVTYDIVASGVTLDKTDLTNAGIDADELLDEPNVAVTNAIGLLPILVAEKGQAPAVPVPEGQQNTGGDTMARTFDLQWVWLVLAIILLGGGLVWVIAGLVRSRRKAREEPPGEERPAWLPPLPPQPQQPQQQQQPRRQQGNDQGTDQGMGSQ